MSAPTRAAASDQNRSQSPDHHVQRESAISEPNKSPVNDFWQTDYEYLVANERKVGLELDFNKATPRHLSQLHANRQQSHSSRKVVDEGPVGSGDGGWPCHVDGSRELGTNAGLSLPPSTRGLESLTNPAASFYPSMSLTHIPWSGRGRLRKILHFSYTKPSTQYLSSTIITRWPRKP